MEAIISMPGFNALFIIVIVLLVVGVIRGATQGFLKLLFSLVAGIIVIVAVAAATPYVANFVATNTTLQSEMSETISSRLEKRAEALLDGNEDQEQGTSDSGLSALGIMLPTLFEKDVTADQTDSDHGLIAELVEDTGVYDAIGDKLSMIVIKGICFIVVLIIVLAIVAIIGNALRKVNDVPVIGKANRLLGIFAGVFESLLGIWIFFAILAFISASGSDNVLIGMIEENVFLEFLYDNNLVVALLSSL